jgi:Flp pilus assembly protein TadG
MMLRMLKHLLHDKRGSAAVELALVAPILGVMVIGIVDMSNAYGRKLVLEQSVQRSIEKVMQTTVDTTVDQTIVDEAAAAAGVPKSQVTLDFWLECDGARQADYNLNECSSTQTEARYIVVSILDRYTPMFPVHFGGIDPDGTYHITATSGIRTR